MRPTGEAESNHSCLGKWLFGFVPMQRNHSYSHYGSGGMSRSVTYPRLNKSPFRFHVGAQFSILTEFIYSCEHDRTTLCLHWVLLTADLSFRKLTPSLSAFSPRTLPLLAFFSPSRAKELWFSFVLVLFSWLNDPTSVSWCQSPPKMGADNESHFIVFHTWDEVTAIAMGCYSLATACLWSQSSHCWGGSTIAHFL